MKLLIRGVKSYFRVWLSEIEADRSAGGRVEIDTAFVAVLMLVIIPFLTVAMIVLAAAGVIDLVWSLDWSGRLVFFGSVAAVVAFSWVVYHLIEGATRPERSRDRHGR